MSILVTFYDEQGSILSRCGAACYDAVPPFPALKLAGECICTGANRGAGKAQATENWLNHGDRWIAEARERGMAVARVARDLDTLTEPLFPLSDLKMAS